VIKAVFPSTILQALKLLLSKPSAKIGAAETSTVETRRSKEANSIEKQNRATSFWDFILSSSGLTEARTPTFWHLTKRMDMLSAHSNQLVEIVALDRAASSLKVGRCCCVTLAL
jgi:hypothetical protein